MAAINYPSTLRMPAVATIQSAERRLISPSGGPFETTVAQRDRLAMQSVVFPVFKPAEVAIFDDWWRVTLKRGGAKFSATWPLPEGVVSAVRRFFGPLHREFIPGGYWRVSGTVEVLGAAMPPERCFDEDFAELLARYTTVSGDGSLFSIVSTPYGAGVNVAAQSDPVVARIRRTFRPRSTAVLSFKFKLGTLNLDDSAEIALNLNGAPAVIFNPRREFVFDVTRRAYLYVGAETMILTASALAVGVWYQVDLSIVSGVGNTIATITRLSDGVVIQTTVSAQSHQTASVNQLDFLADSGGATTDAIFVDIGLC